jgi:hypothetical protein
MQHIIPQERWPDSNASFDTLFYDMACTVTYYLDSGHVSHFNEPVTVYEFVWRLSQRIEAGRALNLDERGLLLGWVQQASDQRKGSSSWNRSRAMEGIGSQCALLLLASPSTTVDELRRIVAASAEDHELLRRIAKHASATVELWREIAAANQHPRVLSFFARNKVAKTDPMLRGYILLHAFDKEQITPEAPSLSRKKSGGSAHEFHGGVCTRCGRQEALAGRFGWSCA